MLHNTLKQVLIAFIIIFLAGVLQVNAEYAVSDQKSKKMLEQEIKATREQVKKAQKELDRASKQSRDSYMKNVKSAELSKSEKFNVARDSYEDAKAVKVVDVKFDKLKKKYESLRTKLGQLEWEYGQTEE